MDIFDALSLIGGLCLFLFGMNMLGDGLAKMSGGKFEQVLERLFGGQNIDSLFFIWYNI